MQAGHGVGVLGHPQHPGGSSMHISSATQPAGACTDRQLRAECSRGQQACRYAGGAHTPSAAQHSTCAHPCAPSASRRPAAIAAPARCRSTPACLVQQKNQAGQPRINGCGAAAAVQRPCQCSPPAGHLPLVQPASAAHDPASRVDVCTLRSPLLPPTLTQLSQPEEASRRTGWPGALDDTREP